MPRFGVAYISFMSTALLSGLTDELLKYRRIGERALAQMSAAGLNRVPVPEGNSAAMIVRHISGNLQSRFTDFLTTDGEKPWRDRDQEFLEREYDRAEMDELWQRGWAVLDDALADLTDDDLSRTVRIRGEPLSVQAALARSLAHVANHVGQLVLLARIDAAERWQTLSIPRGGSVEYNKAPNLESGPHTGADS